MLHQGWRISSPAIGIIVPSLDFIFDSHLALNLPPRHSMSSKIKIKKTNTLPDTRMVKTCTTIKLWKKNTSSTNLTCMETFSCGIFLSYQWSACEHQCCFLAYWVCKRAEKKHRRAERGYWKGKPLFSLHFCYIQCSSNDPVTIDLYVASDRYFQE